MIDIKLFQGDMVDIIDREIPDESVDLVITSPPYNVGVDYGAEVDDERTIDDYIRFSRNAMARIYNVLKIGGRACIEVGGSGRNFPMSWIWQDSAYTYGLKLFSEIGIQHRKTNPCAWGSWLKADAVCTIPNFHMMYVFYKGSDRKISESHTRISKSEWMEWTRGYWKINWSAGNKNHPAAFPFELPIRCMKLFGHSGDVVFDPFAGCGTTGRACIEMGDVSFIGTEIVPKYFTEMKRTLDFENAQLRLFNDVSWVDDEVEESVPVFQGQQLSFFEV